MDGTRVALVIANDEYADPGLRRLVAPAQDAAALADALGDPSVGGFEVTVLQNQSAQAIRLAVEDFFADRAPEDLLLLHFSCHGLKNAAGELFLAVADTKPTRLASTAVAADFVNRQMADSRAQRIALFLDCCYGGAFPRGMVVRAAGEAQVRDAFAEQEEVGGGRGRVIVTASSAMEYAFEGGQLATDASKPSPSVFTSAVVDGLTTGEADRDGDGWVGLTELVGFVTDRVHRVTPNQNPQMWTFGAQGELLIARSRVRRITPTPLAPELLQAMESPLPAARFGVADYLRDRLQETDLGQAYAAWQALHQLVDDDSRKVSQTARRALADAVPSTTPAELDLTTISGDPAEAELHLTGPPIALTASVTTTTLWLRVEQVGPTVRITATPPTPGNHEATITVTGPTGERTIPVTLHATAPQPIAAAEPATLAKPKPVAEPATLAEPEPEPEPKAEPETVAGPEPEAFAGPKLEAVAGPGPEAVAEPEAVAGPAPEAVAEPASGTEPVAVAASAPAGVSVSPVTDPERTPAAEPESVAGPVTVPEPAAVAASAPVGVSASPVTGPERTPAAEPESVAGPVTAPEPAAPKPAASAARQAVSVEQSETQPPMVSWWVVGLLAVGALMLIFMNWPGQTESRKIWTDESNTGWRVYRSWSDPEILSALIALAAALTLRASRRWTLVALGIILGCAAGLLQDSLLILGGEMAGEEVGVWVATGAVAAAMAAAVLATRRPARWPLWPVHVVGAALVVAGGIMLLIQTTIKHDDDISFLNVTKLAALEPLVIVAIAWLALAATDSTARVLLTVTTVTYCAISIIAAIPALTEGNSAPALLTAWLGNALVIAGVALAARRPPQHAVPAAATPVLRWRRRPWLTTAVVGVGAVLLAVVNLAGLDAGQRLWYNSGYGSPDLYRHVADGTLLSSVVALFGAALAWRRGRLGLYATGVAVGATVLFATAGVVILGGRISYSDTVYTWSTSLLIAGLMLLAVLTGSGLRTNEPHRPRDPVTTAVIAAGFVTLLVVQLVPDESGPSAATYTNGLALLLPAVAAALVLLVSTTARNPLAVGAAASYLLLMVVAALYPIGVNTARTYFTAMLLGHLLLLAALALSMRRVRDSAHGRTS
ncbi:caspase, EACC1-associated type [Kribbella monticola]|uniref:caspase, EACC1-associated type n=1 Tax=Kribbella monticola TaxID=2185285 RepID=UPI000DD4BAD2|nr:caspase family protein [Kribbella monticola]